MRFYILLFFIVINLSVFSQPNASSKINLGLKTGVNVTEIIGLPVNGFLKKGFLGGFWLKLKLDKKWNSCIEVLFVQKGSKYKYRLIDGVMTSYKLRLYYMEVPVIFQFHPNKWGFEFGPGFGYLIDAREYFNEDVFLNGFYTRTEQMTQRELSFNLGVSYAFNPQWSFNCRYTNSLLPTRQISTGEAEWTKKNRYNCVLTFAIHYTILTKTKESNDKE